ncbi:MAG: FkbM family methyltransferase [bacterium]
MTMLIRGRMYAKRLRNSLWPGPSRPSAPARHRYRIRGVKLTVFDDPRSSATEAIALELRKDRYGLDGMAFREGDVAIDVGGHVGMVSSYLALRHLALRILAFEPFPDNVACFRRSLEANRVTNVVLSPFAVTSDGRALDLVMHRSNTGGATGQLQSLDRAHHTKVRVPSVTLDAVFEQHGIQRCALLKMDCEGTEHEILRNARCLNRVDALIGEFHINRDLERRGHSIEELLAHCRRFIPADRIRVLACRMAE